MIDDQWIQRDLPALLAMFSFLGAIVWAAWGYGPED